MTNKDTNDLMNEVIEERKVISLYGLARKLAKSSNSWRSPNMKGIQAFIIQDYLKILESDCENGGNDGKSYLEKRYSIKSIGIEEAIKQAYKDKNIEIIFNGETKDLYPEYRFLFYKDERALQKYIKSHVKFKPITVTFCDI